MHIRTPARILVYLTAISAAAALMGWVFWARGALLTGGRPDDIRSGADLLLAIELIAMVVIAQHFPVPVSPRHKVVASDAPYFASLLLFGAPVAAVLTALGELAGQAVLVLRGRKHRGPAALLFNTGQMVLAMSAAGLMYLVFPPLLGIPLAAVTWYVVNTGLVAIITGLQSGAGLRDMFDLWTISRRRHALQVASMLMMAWLTTRASRDPLAALVLAVPGVIVYFAMRRTVQLIVQTVDAVEALSDVVDERDPYTYGHCKRVADYAEKIARALRLPRDKVELIRSAARVHDLGKVGIPDEVLRKPGTLSPDEWVVMEQHTEKGYQILARFPEYREGRELVRAHHERFDGQGYPLRLAGEGIGLGAQVIAVADAFDAMTSDRPYRKALPVAVALAELERGKNRQWEERVVEAAIRALGPAETAQVPQPVATPVPLALPTLQPRTGFGTTGAA
jgi:putative nucleotidyltransferase with HDIG domain